eukprot:scaffold239150_cov50-Attheya_sp.AAC.2
MFVVRAAMAMFFFLRPSVAAYVVNPTRRYISLPSQVSHRYQKTPARALNPVSQEYRTLSSRSPSTRLNAEFDTTNNDSEDDVLVQKPISASFAMDPKSDEARIVTSSLGISDASHLKLVDMARLVVHWNERLNLVSRKDCSLEVVFGRHILPSVALAALPGDKFGVLNEDGVVVNEGYQRKKIVDVGTGGGFPGLPLAIIFPQSDFLLVDSVGKKLSAVSAMVEELGLTNVQTHHGRAEEMVDDVLEGPRHKGAYDVCVGRSVTALPRFCFWVSDLLRKGPKNKEEEANLVYIIGGEIQESVQSRAQLDAPIDELLQITDASDKRALVFTAHDVASIAVESGEVKQVRGVPKAKGNVKRKKANPKGNWEKRDNSVPKQRGYDNFKRFEQN